MGYKKAMDDHTGLDGSIIDVKLPDGRVVKKRKKLVRVMRPKSALCAAAKSKLKLAKMNTSLNSSLVKQSLRTNNKQLARALEAARSDLAACQQHNLQLQEENQALLVRVNELERVAGLRDQEISTEVQMRMNVPLQNVNEALNRVTNHLMGTIQQVEEVHHQIASLGALSRPGSLSTRSSVSSDTTSPTNGRPVRRAGSLPPPKRVSVGLDSRPNDLAALSRPELETAIADALADNIEDETPPPLPAELSIIMEQTFCNEPAPEVEEKPAGRSSRSRSNRRSARLLDAETLLEIQQEIEAEKSQEVEVTDAEEISKPDEPSLTNPGRARSPATRRSKEDANEGVVKRRTRSRSRSLSLKRSSRSKSRDVDSSQRDGKTTTGGATTHKSSKDQESQMSSEESDLDTRKESRKRLGIDPMMAKTAASRRGTYCIPAGEKLHIENDENAAAGPEGKTPEDEDKQTNSNQSTHAGNLADKLFVTPAARRDTYCIPAQEKVDKNRPELYTIPTIGSSPDDTVYEPEDMEFTEVISSHISLMPLPEFIAKEQASEPAFLRNVPEGDVPCGTPAENVQSTTEQEMKPTEPKAASEPHEAESEPHPKATSEPRLTKPSKLKKPKAVGEASKFKHPMGKPPQKKPGSKKETPQEKRAQGGSEKEGESTNRAKFNAWLAKPGKITFTAGRKNPEDIMKEGNKSKPRSKPKSKSTLPKAQSRSKSRSKPRLMPDMSPKTVFDFMGTPRVNKDKEGSEKSVFELSLNESITLPTSTYTEFKNRHKNNATDTETSPEEADKDSKKTADSEKANDDKKEEIVVEATSAEEETEMEATGDHGILLVLGNGKRTKPRSKCKQVTYAESLEETHVTTPQREDPPSQCDTPSSVRKIKHAGLTPPRPAAGVLSVLESPGDSSQDEDCVANVRLVGASDKAPKHSKLTVSEIEHLFSSDSDTDEEVVPPSEKKNKLSHKDKKRADIKNTNKPSDKKQKPNAEPTHSEPSNKETPDGADIQLSKPTSSNSTSATKDSQSSPVKKHHQSKTSHHKNIPKTVHVESEEQENTDTESSDQVESETSKAPPEILPIQVDDEEEEEKPEESETIDSEEPILIDVSPDVTDVKSLRKRKKVVYVEDSFCDQEDRTSPTKVSADKETQSPPVKKNQSKTSRHKNIPRDDKDDDSELDEPTSPIKVNAGKETRSSQVKKDGRSKTSDHKNVPHDDKDDDSELDEPTSPIKVNAGKEIQSPQVKKDHRSKTSCHKNTPHDDKDDDSELDEPTSPIKVNAAKETQLAEVKKDHQSKYSHHGSTPHNDENDDSEHEEPTSPNKVSTGKSAPVKKNHQSKTSHHKNTQEDDKDDDSELDEPTTPNKVTADTETKSTPVKKNRQSKTSRHKKIPHDDSDDEISDDKSKAVHVEPEEQDDVEAESSDQVETETKKTTSEKLPSGKEDEKEEVQLQESEMIELEEPQIIDQSPDVKSHRKRKKEVYTEEDSYCDFDNLDSPVKVVVDESPDVKSHQRRKKVNTEDDSFSDLDSPALPTKVKSRQSRKKVDTENDSFSDLDSPALPTKVKSRQSRKIIDTENDSFSDLDSPALPAKVKSRRSKKKVDTENDSFSDLDSPALPTKVKSRRSRKKVDTENDSFSDLDSPALPAKVKSRRSKKKVVYTEKDSYGDSDSLASPAKVVADDSPDVKSHQRRKKVYTEDDSCSDLDSPALPVKAVIDDSPEVKSRRSRKKVVYTEKDSYCDFDSPASPICDNPVVKSRRKRKLLDFVDDDDNDDYELHDITSPVKVKRKKTNTKKTNPKEDSSASTTSKPPRAGVPSSKKRRASDIQVEDNRKEIPTADPMDDMEAEDEPVDKGDRKKEEVTSSNQANEEVFEPDTRETQLHSCRNSEADENVGGRPKRRTASVKVSYKEPSIGSKLRRGDPIAASIYSGEDIQIYKTDNKRKSTKRGSYSTGRRRSVLSSLNIPNDP